MEESKSLAVRESQSILDLPADEMLAEAKKIAVPLADIVEKQGLYSNINGNNHVKCEGWSTLGSMLGITAKEKSVAELDDGSFIAEMELINMRSGIVVGSGSGYCGMDEKSWKSKPKFARRSMAITRATSKAFKTNFSWIFALAGYNTTPAEEMEGLGEVSHETLLERVRTRALLINDAVMKKNALAFIEINKNNDKKLNELNDRITEVTK